jgi:hypothetical protein
MRSDPYETKKLDQLDARLLRERVKRTEKATGKAAARRRKQMEKRK